MTVRARIVLGVLVIGALTSWLLVRWLRDDLRPQYLLTMEESMVDSANVLAALVAAEAGGLDALRAALDEARRRRFEARIYDLVKTGVALRVYVTDRRGVVIYDSDGGRDEGRDYSQWNDVFLALQGRYGVRTTRTDPDDPESSVLHVAAPVLVAGEVAGVLTIAKPSASVNAAIRAQGDKIVWAGAAAAAGMVGLGVALSLWVTWPLRRLTAWADAVREGRPAPMPRLGTFGQWGHSEVGALGRSVAGMREALEGRKHLENTVLALTHQIKGPLAGIRGAAELLREEVPEEQRRRFLDSILAEGGRIERILDRMLELAALESRTGLRGPEELDLGDLGREAAGEVAERFTLRGVALEVDAAGGARVRGERALLRTAVLNLLENALAFTPAGGSVRLAAVREGGAVLVRVEDTGTGVPDYALGRVFERAYTLPRPDTGERGSGFGLNIVHAVAELHGGSASLRNRDGGGVIAEVRLPATA